MFIHSLNHTPLTVRSNHRSTAVRALLVLVLAPALALLLVPSPATAIPAVSAPAATQSPNPAGTSHLVVRDGSMTDWIMEFDDDGTWDVTKPDGTVIAHGLYYWDATTDKIFYSNESNDGGGGHFGEYIWNEDLMQWDRLWSSHPKAPTISLLPGDFA